MELNSSLEPSLSFLGSLSTAEQRRAATAISRVQLLASVRALVPYSSSGTGVGCQRCLFVPTVLAAFDPELAAAVSTPTLIPATTAGGGLPSMGANGGGNGADTGTGTREASLAVGAASSDAEEELLAHVRSGGSGTGGMLAPAQLLALLSNSGGSEDLVGLLQFAWKEVGAGSSSAGSGNGGGNHSSGSNSSNGGSSSGGWLALSDTLLCKPRLLRRFLTESLSVMQALEDDVGDCRRHVGYPGPAELASTLARLDLQRSHTLERLAAWGVMRAPGQNQQQQNQQQQPPLQNQQSRQHTQQQQLSQQRTQQAQQVAQQPQGGAGDAGAVDTGAEGWTAGGEEDDAGLAMAIRLSLQETGFTPPPAPPLRRASSASGDGGGVGASPGPGPRQGVGERPGQQQGQAGTPTGSGANTGAMRNRAQRTPPRPTGRGGDGGGGGGGAAFGAASPSRGLGTWPGPSPGGHGPGNAGGPGSAAGRQPRPLGESLEGLAACGLAEEAGHEPAGRLHTAVFSSPLLPDPLSRSTAPTTAPPTASAITPGPATAILAPVPPPPLPVSAVVAAAAGVADATALVDAAAVAALPLGLQERVQHLVAQLVQVQQRHGRLQHACQHGIVAAGRKLLLILLQLLWSTLRAAAREAAAAASRAEVAVAEAEAMAAVASAVSAMGTGTGTGGCALPPPPPPRHAPAAPGIGAGTPGSVSLQSWSQRRRPRYEGLLADLASGLGDQDTHMDMEGLGLNDGDKELSYDLDAASSLDSEDLDGGGEEAAGAELESTRELAWARALAREEEREAAVEEESWDDALRTSITTNGGGNAARRAGAALAVQLRQSSAPTSAVTAAVAGVRASLQHGARRAVPNAFPTDATRATTANATAATAATAATSGSALPGVRRSLAAVWGAATATGGGTYGEEAGSGSARWRAAEQRSGRNTADMGVGGGGGGGCNGGGGCQPGCLEARSEQAEQLRMLQSQLGRCQCSQSELQHEVGRLLDLLAESRRAQEQTTSSVRRELAKWQGDAQALQGLGPEELADLAGRMEAALSRVRGAHLQASAERDLMCPVCWEARKGLVFGCGHQTCVCCGDKLSACPICREPVSLRIRVYS